MPVSRTNASTANTFFKAPQGAAVLKHGIQKRYLPVFATKVSRYAAERRVIFLDGYAGRGTYEDGSAGSPAIAMEVARNLAVQRQPRDLRCIFVEPDRDLLVPLRSLVRGSSHVVLDGTIEDHLDEVVDASAGSPLLAFLDPFGLGMPLDNLAERLLSRPRGVGLATEVLLNFNMTGLPRIGGLLASTNAGPGGETTLRRFDAVMGGPEWRELWDPDDSEASSERVAQLYCDTASKAGGQRFGYYSVGVSDRWEGRDQYKLILLSAHPDGLWYFSEAISLSIEDFYAWCHPDQQTTDDPALRSQEWIDDIAANLEALLAEKGDFTVIRETARVYGVHLGRARGKHVRAAVKKLYVEGKTSSTGVGGSPEDIIVRRPATAIAS